jgi:hypothetical protein
VGDAEDAAGDQHRECTEYGSTGHGLSVAEDRRGVVEQTEASEQTIPDAVGRVPVQTHPDRLGFRLGAHGFVGGSRERGFLFTGSEG